MRTAGSFSALVAVCLWLSGCSTPRNQPLAAADFREGYGYRQADRSGQVLSDTFVIATFSGGGTRAAALAQGVLREFAAMPIAGGADRRLADEIDMVSSVSGGSVTAANFALNGRGSFAGYEAEFLKHNMMVPLIFGFVNPVNWPRFWFTSDSRIDLLVDLLNEHVFAEKTYADLQQQTGRPFLILNAADMSSGSRFPFTQSTFDLLCSDMSRLQVAQAVAASAAFPVGLTPVTLTNYSPCALQETSEGQSLISRIRDDQLESTYGNGDIPGQSSSDVVFIDANNNLPRRSQGLREGRLLNQDRRKDYVHLLDGGIADNLGLAEPLDLVTGGAGRDGAPAEDIRQYVFVIVNARSDTTTDRDLSPATPGIPAMALSSINAAIDGRTFGLQAQLSVLPAVLKEGRDKCAGDAAGSDCQGVEVISVDFELIREPECRQAFANIGTNWALNDRVVDSLMEMGSAMVLASPHFRQLARRAGSQFDATDEALAATAQARARQACARLLHPDATLPPVRFGTEGS